tara:strand:- start:1335 stop:1760 length:426 start_codon:yes stop_codon:yes gene_type:complete
MKLTRKTDYALRLLTRLARGEQSQVLPTRLIAESEDISLKYLQSVASQLVASGLIESVPGAKGGNILAKPANKISVLDVIEIMEGQLALMDCMELSTNCCEFQGCGIHGLLGRAQIAMNEVLSSESIADLAGCPVSNEVSI